VSPCEGSRRRKWCRKCGQRLLIESIVIFLGDHKGDALQQLAFAKSSAKPCRISAAQGATARRNSQAVVNSASSSTISAASAFPIRPYLQFRRGQHAGWRARVPPMSGYFFASQYLAYDTLSDGLNNAHLLVASARHPMSKPTFSQDPREH